MGLAVRWTLSWCLLPFALPLLLVLATYAGTVVWAGIVGYVIDLLVLAADILRSNRIQIEAITLWASASLRWASIRYLQVLLAAQQGMEDTAETLIAAGRPAVEAAMSRSPLLARVLQPPLRALGAVAQAADAGYAFVHDEVVPVALDISERLPLMEELLSRLINPVSQETGGQPSKAWRSNRT